MSPCSAMPHREPSASAGRPQMPCGNRITCLCSHNIWTVWAEDKQILTLTLQLYHTCGLGLLLLFFACMKLSVFLLSNVKYIKDTGHKSVGVGSQK